MRTNLLRIVRIAVSLGLLILVFRLAKVDELVLRLREADPVWLLAAFGINSVGNLFGAWRWQLLLRSQGRRLSLPYLYGSYLVGLLWNIVLPTSIGGDVMRASSAKSKGGGTLTENLTVVLVERMIGLLATLSLGGLAALSGAAGSLDPRITWVLGCALGLSIVGLYLALSNHVRRFTLRFLDRVPIEFVRRTVGKMLVAFELFSRAHGTLFVNYLLSLGFQFLLIVHFWVLQFAFGGTVPFSTFLVVVPLVFFAMLLPIGINGLGVREAAFIALLEPAGMERATALALSLASYGLAIAQGMLGGVVYFWRSARGQAPTPATDPEEVAAEL